MWKDTKEILVMLLRLSTMPITLLNLTNTKPSKIVFTKSNEWRTHQSWFLKSGNSEDENGKVVQERKWKVKWWKSQMKKKVVNARWATIYGTMWRDKLPQKEVRWRQKTIKQRYEREIKYRFLVRHTEMKMHTASKQSHQRFLMWTVVNC